MARDPVSPPALPSGAASWRPSPPWALALLGLVLSLAGLLPPSLADVRAGFLGVALLLAGVAVKLRLERPLGDFESRLTPAALVATAALAALLASLGFGDEWDSGRMLAGVLSAVGFAGALLILLPPTARKVCASLLILFHFGGILTATTAIEPAGAQAPWLSLQAWGHVYRPYLGFLYLNNAYHFYSPEPGPPTLLWSRVYFASGDAVWVRFPMRRVDPIPLHYQRLLALTESINLMRGNPTDPAEVRELEFLQDRRKRGAALGDTIPMHPNPAVRQYAEPQDFAKKMTGAYARHLAHTTVNEKNPSDPVKAVRIYRVIHSIIDPVQLAHDQSPLDRGYYLTYYQGEYDPEGNLLSREKALLDGSGEVLEPRDPYLYWLIPIFRDPDNPEVVHDYLEKHARMQFRLERGR